MSNNYQKIPRPVERATVGAPRGQGYGVVIGVFLPKPDLACVLCSTSQRNIGVFLAESRSVWYKQERGCIAFRPEWDAPDRAARPACAAVFAAVCCSAQKQAESNAGVAELADAQVSKTCGACVLSYLYIISYSYFHKCHCPIFVRFLPHMPSFWLSGISSFTAPIGAPAATISLSAARATDVSVFCNGVMFSRAAVLS